MKNTAPIQEPPGTAWSRSWVSWFQQVFQAIGWTRTYVQEFDYDFGSIPAQSQASTIAMIEGVRAGASVLLTPAADTPGIVYSAVATSAGNVTIYAKNFTSSPVDPGNTDFRVIVFQN